MKRILFLVLITTILVGSCKKNNPSPTPIPTLVSDVPASVTKKILIEEYTGAWCGYCVDGAVIMGQEIDKYLGKVIGMSIHQGDAMQTPEYKDFYGTFTNTVGFPAGMVNRENIYGGYPVIERTLWAQNVSGHLNGKAQIGLAINAENISGNTLTIKVKICYLNDYPDSHNLSVCLTEDSISGTGSGYNQSNVYAGNSNFKSHPFYSKPSVIVGYQHRHVYRKAITLVGGNPLDTPAKKGTWVEKSFTVDISAYEKTKLSVVAFVNAGNAGKILNAQEVKVGSNKVWD
ncbi:MAG: Omp28-related outer membrane protein [Bacteroidetes bacterium]|nr:Omp28-related outer membrane protein [Bacteroidota bacterium]